MRAWKVMPVLLVAMIVAAEGPSRMELPLTQEQIAGRRAPTECYGAFLIPGNDVTGQATLSHYSRSGERSYRIAYPGALRTKILSAHCSQASDLIAFSGSAEDAEGRGVRFMGVLEPATNSIEFSGTGEFVATHVLVLANATILAFGHEDGVGGKPRGDQNLIRVFDRRGGTMLAATTYRSLGIEHSLTAKSIAATDGKVAALYSILDNQLLVVDAHGKALQLKAVPVGEREEVNGIAACRDGVYLSSVQGRVPQARRVRMEGMIEMLDRRLWFGEANWGRFYGCAGGDQLIKR